MKSRIVSALMVAALAAPTMALAQEEQEYQRGELVEVFTWEIQPDQAMAFEAAVEKIVEAAKVADLADYKWSFWNDVYTYTLVYPVGNFAYFDDPEQWMRPIMGTPGEEMLTEAFAAFDDINSRVVAQEIAEHKMDWSYEPEAAEMMEPGYVHVDEFWVRGGKDDEFDEVVKEFMAFFKEMGYAYSVYGHEMHFGDAGRAVFVTTIDDLGAYYGPKGIEVAIEANDAGERWEELLGKLAGVVNRHSHGNMAFMPNMTYWPEEQQQATQ